METLKNHFIKGVWYSLIFSFLAAIFEYLLRVILSRKLDILEFGLFYAVFSFISFFIVLKNFGISESLGKLIPELKEKKLYQELKSTLMTSLILQLIIVFIIIIGIYILSDYLSIHYFKHEKSKLLLFILLPYLVFDALHVFISGSLRGFKQFLSWSIMFFSRRFIVFLFAIILLIYNYNIYSPALAYVIGSILTSIIFGIILYKSSIKDIIKEKYNLNKKITVDLIKTSFPLLIINTSLLIINSIDVMFITHYLDLKAVAIYSTAYPLAKIMLFLIEKIPLLLFPMVATGLIINTEKTKEFIYSALKYSYVISTFFVILSLYYPEEIINFFFGEKFKLGKEALQILSIGFFFYSIATIFNYLIMNKNKTKTIYKLFGITVIINIILNIILIPLLGINGAALATSISYFVLLITSLITIKKLWGEYFIFSIFKKNIIIFTIIFILIPLLLNNLQINFYIKFIIFTLIYGIAIFGFNIINIKEFILLVKNK